MPVAPARHAGPPALTHLACPRAVAWVLFVFAWGRALLGLVVGVFARWVAEFRVYARGVFVWVFACLLVCARLGVVGQCGCVRPTCPGLLACLLACLRSGVGLLACARLVCARWAEGGLVGAGQSCPAPYCVAWATSVAPWRGRERGVACGVLSWCANARAHAEGGGGEGEPREADRGGLGVGCGWWRVGW